MDYKTIFQSLAFLFFVVSCNNIMGQNDSLQKVQLQEKNEEVINFYVIENKPEFPGGQVAMLKYIAENTKYPEIAKEKGISGKVFVQFVIDKDGSVTKVKVMRGVNRLLDKEAIRVVKSMPKWKPGTIHGKAVKVLFQLPINFTLY